MGESTCVPEVPLAIPDLPHIPPGSLNRVQQHVVWHDEARAGRRPLLHVHLHDLLPSFARHQRIEEWIGSGEHIWLKHNVKETRKVHKRESYLNKFNAVAVVAENRGKRHFPDLVQLVFGEGGRGNVILVPEQS